jgi:hypothetical protein
LAQNLTSGAIQVIDTSVESLNHAFAQILEQIDSLRGLRGITALYDQATVSTPTQGDAAVRLDQLQALLSDPADPFAAAQRVHASQDETGFLDQVEEPLLTVLAAQQSHPAQDEQAFLGDLEETLLALLTARQTPTATQVYYAEGIETMNLYSALQQMGSV